MENKTWAWRIHEVFWFKKDTVIAFIRPKFRLFSKLSSANQTGLLSSAQTQVNTAPVFSGMREQKPTDASFAHFKEITADTSIIGGKNIHTLTTMLSSMSTKLVNKIKNDGVIKMGTVKWLWVSFLYKSQADRDAEPGSLLHGDSSFFLASILDE